MTNENYKRASEIQDEIRTLSDHLSYLDDMDFPECMGMGISFRANDNCPLTELRHNFIPASFCADYVKNVKNRIAELRDEFKNL